MARHPDWTARLRAAIADGGDRPFAWGRHDCCEAAAALAAAIADIDLTAP